MMRLKDKVAIVSGGARGIGEASGKALASNGAKVVLADILEQAGQSAAMRIGESGGVAHYRRLEVSDAQSWSALVRDVVEQYGRVDCLVNNAAIDIAATIESARIEDFQKILDINLFGPFHGMQAVIPFMKQHGGGSIINIASLATRMAAPTTTAYGASKAALANLTKTAALHCAQQGYGIRINSVHPGPVDTPMLFGDGARGDSADVAGVIGMIPMGRLGKADDIGDVVTFLASDESRYMTGAELFVDGGLSMI